MDIIVLSLLQVLLTKSRYHLFIFVNNKAKIGATNSDDRLERVGEAEVLWTPGDI
jgi:hypothetical protein